MKIIVEIDSMDISRIVEIITTIKSICELLPEQTIVTWETPK